ncbi:hypothetical protein GCM10008170_01150 [Methylopila capsulata]|uniref:Uncharacterized protein n=1 Tax=Methylopila capsulata TaxID=61654 RepID=A0A9W6IS46_9HYPH|nr:hypothetical protein GCM10008170_01150 [Methylopila capsulata]
MEIATWWSGDNLYPFEWRRARRSEGFDMLKIIFGSILISGVSLSPVRAESTWFPSAKPLSADGYWDVRIVPPNKWPTKIWTVPPRKSGANSGRYAEEYKDRQGSQKTR